MPNQDKRVIPVSFRWPAQQVGENKVEVSIPLGVGEPVINPRFAVNMKLNDAEVASAEYAALREIVVIR